MLTWRLLFGFALMGTAPVAQQPAAPAPTALPAIEPRPQSAPAVAPFEPQRPSTTSAPVSFEKPLVGGQRGTPPVVIDGIEYELCSLGPVARDYFNQGKYQRSLELYRQWEPRHFCVNCLYSMRDTRSRQIAMCHSHLGDHAAAARVCLEAAGMTNCGDNGAAVFLIQVYRTAGQLNDLGPLLDEVEQAIAKKPTTEPLTPQERAERLAFTGAGAVRRHLKAEQLGSLAPWPDGVPKPKLGTLPKSLTK